MDYKVGETWLDCCTQRVVISGLKSSLLLGTSDLPEGLYLRLILSIAHQSPGQWDLKLKNFTNTTKLGEVI